MDNSAQWPQGFGVVKAGVDHPTSSGSLDHQQQKRQTLARPQKDQIVNCPRCNSVNTKFCYYNNYSLSQTRYFCKTCRRYWTAGGSLRNVPVGGGSRKNRRSSSLSSSASATSSFTASAQQAQAQATVANTSLQQGHDLNLSFPPHLKPPLDDIYRHHQYPNMPNPTFTTKPNFNIDSSSSSKLLSHHLPNPNSSSMTPLLPPMGLFKNSALGNNEPREMIMSSMMNPQLHHRPTTASIFSSAGFPQMHHDQDHFKPSSLNFSLDGFTGDDGYASTLQLGNSSDGINNAGARLLFPFNQDNQNLNKDQHQQQVPSLPGAASSAVQFDHSHTRSSPSSVQGGGGADGSSTAGFWTGMLSGGSW